MALQPDDTVCFCFHVTLRKIETFCAVEKPRHASQISECLSAGTGCGWCVPMLKRIHKRACGDQEPWWRQAPASDAAAGAGGSAAGDAADVRGDEAVDAQAYRSGRKRYIQEGKGTPPAGAET